jgi:hypothetical protein
MRDAEALGVAKMVQRTENMSVSRSVTHGNFGVAVKRRLS